MLFSSFRVVKTKFHHFWPPVEKLLEKSTSAPPGKIPSDAHAHKHGRNLVGDTGDVSPHFFRRGDIIRHVPTNFFSVGLYLERFQK